MGKGLGRKRELEYWGSLRNPFLKNLGRFKGWGRALDLGSHFFHLFRGRFPIGPGSTGLIPWVGGPLVGQIPKGSSIVGKGV